MFEQKCRGNTGKSRGEDPRETIRGGGNGSLETIHASFVAHLALGTFRALSPTVVSGGRPVAVEFPPVCRCQTTSSVSGVGSAISTVSSAPEESADTAVVDVVVVATVEAFTSNGRFAPRRPVLLLRTSVSLEKRRDGKLIKVDKLPTPSDTALLMGERVADHSFLRHPLRQRGRKKHDCKTFSWP